jgi:hypothetical protein
LALCDAQLGTNDHAELAKAALELTAIGFYSPFDTYDATCYMAQCIPLAEKDEKLSAEKRTELAQQYADQAMLLLKQAVAEGYKDGEHMKNDEDLAPLRSRDDFKNLFDAIERSRHGLGVEEPDNPMT